MKTAKKSEAVSTAKLPKNRTQRKGKPEHEELSGWAKAFACMLDGYRTNSGGNGR